MERNIIMVDFSFAKYVPNVNSVSSFLPIPAWKRFLSLFTHQLYLSDNNRLEDKVSEADVVILMDTRKDYDVVAKRIERVCKDSAKLIFYSWNPITESEAHTRLDRRWIKTSFSRKDSLSGELKYVGSFYFKNVILHNAAVKYDGLFIGRDKGRREMLNKVASLYKSNNLLSKIILVDNRKALYDRQYSWRISYDIVCKYVEESNSVIEILQEGQEGISLRVFESLFFEKKLVTNNCHIIDYDFYDSRNIFILGKDNDTRFREFILSPYVKISDEVLSRYTIKNWLARMLSL